MKPCVAFSAPRSTHPTHRIHMTHLFSWHAARSFALAALLLPSLALADAGHDHGDAPAAAAGTALPRFAAASELFELVGVLDGKTLTLYLDHAADNRPVKDAKLEVELAGAPLTLVPHGEGEFKATLSQALAQGVTPVTATVITASDSDLLAGEIDLHKDAHEHAPATMSASTIGLGAAGAVALLVVLIWLGRRIVAARSLRTGDAA